MEKQLFSILLATLVAATSYGGDTIRISGTRLAYPLFERWAAEYHTAHPDVAFVISNSLSVQQSDLVIAAYAVTADKLPAGKTAIPLAKYVQLPVANAANPKLPVLVQKGFSTNDLQAVFLQKKQLATGGYDKLFTVYTREKPACATIAFASHLHGQATDIKGTGVKGDDRDLLQAVKNDVQAVSYNNAGFIYNLSSRKVADSIAVVPIDINNNGRIDHSEHFYQNVDELLAFVEKSGSASIPVEKVNVLVSKVNRRDVLNAFLHWVLKEGQQYNHALGFVKLSDTLLEDGLASLSTNGQAFDLDALYGKQE